MMNMNYGLDSPPVVRRLCWIGVLFLIIGFLIQHFFQESFPATEQALFEACLWIGFTQLLFAILMVLSSAYGKVILGKKLVASLDLHGEEHVLDVGCGRGLLLIAIAKKLNKNAKTVGLDLWRKEDLSFNQPESVFNNIHREKIDCLVELKSGDMLNMPFADHTFDVVVSSMAIHNLAVKEKCQRAINEINRVLKPGGKLYLLDFKYTKIYRDQLHQLGWKDVKLSRYYFWMFPPVRIVSGIKPIGESDVKTAQ